MTEETKAKIKASHLKRIQDNPDAVNKLRAIANDPDMKAARSAKMKALWADPDWRAQQLAKMATTTGARETTAPAPAKKKRVISAEKKAQYAAARKAKRAAAKAAKLANTTA